MNPAPEPLPNDITALRAMLAQAWAERDAERAEKAQLAAKCDQLASQNDRLRHLIRQLQRLRFGRRSEKLDPDQLNLALEDVEQAVAEIEAQQEKVDPALKRTRAETRRELALEAAIARLDKYHLLILDDLAYVTKDQAETSVLFELIGARYERRSLLVTANQPFGQWGKIFPD